MNRLFILASQTADGIKNFRNQSGAIYQFIRYFFAAGLAFTVDFLTLFILTTHSFFIRNYFLAITLAFAAGTITNYLISIFWVFNKRNLNHKALEFLAFALIGLIGLFLNFFIIWVSTEYLIQLIIPGLSVQHKILLSKLFSTTIVYFWNFTARKIILFR